MRPFRGRPSAPESVVSKKRKTIVLGCVTSEYFEPFFLVISLGSRGERQEGMEGFENGPAADGGYNMSDVSEYRVCEKQV